MPTTNEQKITIEGFAGIQVGTSRFIKQPTELDYAQNTSYDEVGSLSKKKGFVKRGDDLSSTTTTSTSTTTTSTSSSSTTSTSTTTTA